MTKWKSVWWLSNCSVRSLWGLWTWIWTNFQIVENQWEDVGCLLHWSMLQRVVRKVVLSRGSFVKPFIWVDAHSVGEHIYGDWEAVTLSQPTQFPSGFCTLLQRQIPDGNSAVCALPVLTSKSNFQRDVIFRLHLSHIQLGSIGACFGDAQQHLFWEQNWLISSF